MRRDVLARLSTLETSYGNATIHSMQDTVKRLTERVGTLEEQGKQLGGQLCSLFNTINQHGADASQKTETLDGKLGELGESLRALREGVVNDAVNQMSTSAEAATLRLEATTQQITREFEAVKENMHYSIVKKESDDDNDALEQVALLKGTMGTCLLQQSELHQSVAGLTKSVASLQQDLAKLVAHAHITRVLRAWFV